MMSISDISTFMLLLPANVILKSVLRSLNLPSSLDALERPIGLPPSLLKKAEEVRLEEGPARIEESIDNIERFAEHNAKLLDEVQLRILAKNSIKTNLV